MSRVPKKRGPAHDSNVEAKGDYTETHPLVHIFFFFLNTHYVHSAPGAGTWHAFDNRQRIQGRGSVNRPVPRMT